MSNETLEPIFLNDTQMSIVTVADKLVSDVYTQLYTDSETIEDDLKTVLASLKHESIVDNILYGGEFEIKATIFNSIKDNRVQFDKIKIEEFKKPVAKFDKDTGTHTTDYVKFVRVLNGYSDKSVIDYKTYFHDTYEGSDKDKILSLLDSIKDYENKVLLINNQIKEAKTNKDMPNQTEQRDVVQTLDKLNKEFMAILDTMPEHKHQISLYEQRLDSFRKSKHTHTQNVLNNRMSTIRIAMKHKKTLEAQENLRVLKEKHTSLRQLFKKIENENKIKELEN